MPLFHVDQRPVRARCEAILAGVPGVEQPEFAHRLDVARMMVERELLGCTLVFGAHRVLLSRRIAGRLRAGDVEAARRLLARAIPDRGPLRRGRVAAGVAAGVVVIGAVFPLPALILAVALVPVLVIGLALGVDFCEDLLRLMRSRDGRRAFSISGELSAALGSPDAGARLPALLAELRGLAARRPDDLAVAELRAVAMRIVATWAAAAAARDVLTEVYDQARLMIAEDRVPPRSGHVLVEVIEQVSHMRPFPLDLLRVLRKLVRISPGAALGARRVEDAIEDRMTLRKLELLRLIRTESKPATRIDHIAEVIELLGVIDERTRQLDRAADAIAPVLQELSADSDPAIAERAGALRHRLAELGTGAPTR